MTSERIHPLRQMPVDCCPKGVPVLVSGGIAMRKTGGVWFSGMTEPAFTRPLNWTPEWWSNIPQANDPLLEKGDTHDHPEEICDKYLAPSGSGIALGIVIGAAFWIGFAIGAVFL